MFKILSIFFSIVVIASSANSQVVFGANQLVEQAKARTLQNVTYDGRYISIDYPDGDVPSNIGVCTDVIVRAYRGIGIDLQKRVHEDMKVNFAAYPSKRIWGLSKPDANIDHRRVPNLQVFFSRHGTSLNVSDKPASYLPGDIVSWMLPGNLPHIGIVVDEYSPIDKAPLIVHNIGAGPKMENMLFNSQITGHYRYLEQ